MEGSRFREWSAWPRYRSLQGFGKSGFSGDRRPQNSAAVLAGMISMEAIKIILMEIARGPAETLNYAICSTSRSSICSTVNMNELHRLRPRVVYLAQYFLQLLLQDDLCRRSSLTTKP